ncbi:MAG: YitT family protein [Oscillospiraceae bacterium]|jgi:uncharacterized membrane-anchored protein YitT (DUF2179 family)|nr:YitT family protein [Oscillospiraceae bacterium]
MSKRVKKKKREESRRSVKSTLTDILFFVLGAAVYGLAVNCFTASNNIAMGGLTGVSTVLNYLFHFPIGLTIAILNIPLFIWGAKALGIKFLGRTLVGTVLASAAIDIFAFVKIPVYEGDRLLAAIFGGVLAGAGLALIFMRGGTTGGSDLLARLIYRKFRHVPIGRLILILDLVVIIFALTVYRNIESALYSIITIYTSSAVVDSMLYGLDSGKVLFIVTKKPKETAESILHKLGRGVTKIKGEGAFTGSASDVLMCAVRKNEVFKVRDIVTADDPSAFIIIGTASEILGEGFKDAKE